MSAPVLTRRDLATDLERLYGASREHFLVAYHGTGEEDQLEVHGAKVRILPVRGELELRRHLLALRDEDRVAFLVPWTVEMPIDLQCRFAKNGRVFRIGPGVRIGRLFGAAEIDPAVRDSPLGDYLLAHHAADSFPIVGGRLTVDAMWTGWLDRAWGLESGGELALDVLLGWGAIDGRGAAFAESMVARGAGAVRDGLLAHLAARLGLSAPILWRAWEGGRGPAALELALVIGALGAAATADPTVATWLRVTAQQVFGAPVPPEALIRMGEAADTALRYVERRAGAERVRRIVLAADQRADDEALRPHLVASTRLPSAWRVRLDRLGKSLAAAAASPSAAAATVAVEHLQSLRGHQMFASTEQTPVVRRAEMAVRLAAWLAVRPDRDLEPAVSTFGDVEALAGWYVREGGYLDWARRAARGGDESELGRGIGAVMAAVDAARVELDRRFARALPHWHDAGRPATQVVPIDQAVKKLVAAFLDEDPGRRLLVVLMDGMAWAQAAELLESMGQRASVWGPLAWHGMAAHRIGDAPFPPVITSFPTLTEISRAAFFAGKAMPAGPSPSTADDPKRWGANREALKFSAATDVPQLLLRGESQARDGSAKPEALNLVADRARRLVAVVINTIDMSLKGDIAHQHRWTVDAVKSLHDLLDAAAAAGRAVLLCSDHGHVPSDRFASAGAMETGARWRPWHEPQAPIAEHEIGLRAGDGVWAPRGKHGIVLISDDTHRYGGGAGSGEHGGASLAEVVAPCLLIGNADTPGSADDRGQAVRPARAPAWWTFDLVAQPALEVIERRTRKPRIAADRQLELVPPPVSPVPAVPARPALASPLTGSKLLEARAPKSQDRERVIAAVEFLRARNGVADATAFAAELGEFAARIQGLVSRMSEVLNVDGYTVIRFDHQTRQVHLDVAKLAQQFEIEL